MKSFFLLSLALASGVVMAAPQFASSTAAATIARATTSVTSSQATTTSTTSKTTTTATTTAPGTATSTCITSAQAKDLVNKFGSLISNFNNATAIDILVPSFTDTSDSVNQLAGIPLGTTTFTSRQAFIDASAQQPKVPFSVLAIASVTCDGIITFRWRATPGSKPVQGINIMYAGVAKGGKYSMVGTGGWQIQQVYAEFNSGAWIQDLGGNCTAPPPQ